MINHYHYTYLFSVCIECLVMEFIIFKYSLNILLVFRPGKKTNHGVVFRLLKWGKKCVTLDFLCLSWCMWYTAPY